MTRTVFTNLTMWTGEGDDVEGHVVIADGRVLSVAAGAYSGHVADVEVLDLDGGCLVPGFGDGHAHPVFGALERLGPPVRMATTVDDLVDAVAGYASSHPEQTWIVGASYSPTLTRDGVFDATWLDRAVRDRPVVLRASDYHTVWCNTEALARAGITAATPDPPLGRIVRRPDGTPCGTLREPGAGDLILSLVPSRSREELRQAVLEAGRICASMGLTWVLDAWVDVDSGLVDAYLDVAAAGRLATRFELALRADPRSWREQRQVFTAERRRVADASPDGWVRANTIKFFADGIIESGTALMLSDYCGAVHDRGLAVWESTELQQAVAAVDADGFQVHLHAIGDGGVRMALDAVERMRRVNPRWDRRPVLTHLQVVSDQDLPRFAELGVIANFQPYWAHFDEFQSNLTMPRLGERGRRQYPMASLARTGARLSFGTDWPVSTLHPMQGIGVAVTRAVADGPGQSWLPEECLSRAEALRACTSGTAFQAAAESQRGRIAPGLIADLVWLSANPFRVASKDLASIVIRGTWLAGQRTHPDG